MVTTLTLAPMPVTTLAPMPVMVTVDEDLIRQSLLSAIDVVTKAMHGGDGWFAITKTGQTFLLDAQQHLNDELSALLRGTYLEFVQQQAIQGQRRS